MDTLPTVGAVFRITMGSEITVRPSSIPSLGVAVHVIRSSRTKNVDDKISVDSPLSIPLMVQPYRTVTGSPSTSDVLSALHRRSSPALGVGGVMKTECTTGGTLIRIVSDRTASPAPSSSWGVASHAIWSPEENAVGSRVDDASAWRTSLMYQRYETETVSRSSSTTPLAVHVSVLVVLPISGDTRTSSMLGTLFSISVVAVAVGPSVCPSLGVTLMVHRWPFAVPSAVSRSAATLAETMAGTVLPIMSGDHDINSIPTYKVHLTTQGICGCAR